MFNLKDQTLSLRGLVASLPEFGLKKADGKTTMEFPREAQKVAEYLEIFNATVRSGQIMTAARKHGQLEDMIEMPLAMAVGDGLTRLLPLMNVATSHLGFRVVGANNDGGDGPKTSDMEAKDIFQALVNISQKLTEANNTGTLDKVLEQGAREEISQKGYMVVRTPESVGLITHWELRRGFMTDPNNPVGTVPLPAGIPTLTEWKKTYNDYAKNETALEQATIAEFIERFKQNQEQYGFAKDKEIRVFDTEMSEPKRTAFLVKQLQQHFPDNKIVYNGVGFKDDLFDKVKTELDKLGVENDVRLGTFAHKDALAEGKTYQPKKDKAGVEAPYEDFPKADIVFRPFGAPYFGTHARDNSDAIGSMMKENGIAIALTSLGHDLRRIKDGSFGHMFRPDGKPAPLHDASFGAIKVVYSNAFEMPKVDDAYWSDLMLRPRASYDVVPPTEEGRKMDNMLAFLLHVPPAALAPDDRGPVLCAIKHQLELNKNMFASHMAMTVAPAPGASMEMKQALSASAPAPKSAARGGPAGPAV